MLFLEKWVIGILLFALPLVVLPIYPSPFEIPKVSIFLTLIAILTIIKIAYYWQNRATLSITSDIPKIKWAVFAVVLTTAYFHLLSNFSTDLWWGNVYRPQGSLIYLGLAALFLFSKYQKEWEPNFFKWSGWLIWGLLLSLLIVGRAEGFRFFGALGEANAMAATVLFSVALVSGSSNRQRLFSAIVSFILVILSGSRSGILGWVLVMITANFTLIKSVNVRKLALMVASLTMIIGFVSVIFVERESHDSYTSNGLYRWQIWQSAWWTGLSNPILGVGFGGADQAIQYQAMQHSLFIKFLVVDNAHNWLLQWWVTGGIVGVVTILTAVILAIKYFIDNKNLAYLAALVGIITVQTFNPPSIVNLVELWWLLGVGLSSQKSKLA